MGSPCTPCDLRGLRVTAFQAPATSSLDEPPTLGRAAAAGKPAVVVRFPVVGGELLAGRDGAPRIELRAIRSAANEGVRIARVIDEAKAARAARRVERVALELHDRDDPPPL